MDSRYIRQWINRLKQAEPRESPLPPEPEYLKGLFRELRTIPAPESARQEGISVGEARQRIRDALGSYLAGPAESMLLIKALPGIGKTTAAVEIAEQLAAEGRRVLYAGPRHDFYGDIMAIARRPELWYEWLPRQKEDLERRKIQTCGHVEAINTWMHRGYRGIEFCERVCGWDSVKVCPYHVQKNRREPCIFGQHQHITLGHPLKFDVVIGDEDPCQVFQWKWSIPARWVYVHVDPVDPLAEVLHILAGLADDAKEVTHGGELLARLGGPGQVLAACTDFCMPVDASVLAPDIHDDGDVADVPYAHLQHLVPLLAREARAAQAGQDYPHRVIAGKGHLTLLLRHTPNDQLPDHVVWLDGTGNRRLYEACFRRQVTVVDAQPSLRGRIFQVHDRSNGKASLLDKNNEPTGKAPQLEAQVQRIIETRGYKSPAIISYVKLIEQTQTFRDLMHTHFYAARGTNALEEADSLFILGVPQPPLVELESLAAMLFWERMAPFASEWVCKDVAYNYCGPDGQGRCYPASGFWSDPDLQAVLWSVREAELIQAAHRARPVLRDVDIWLLFNLPIWELPPAELLSIADVFGAPRGVDAYQWPRVVEVAERCSRERGAVTSVDLVRDLGLARHTALKYIDLLVQERGWIAEAAASEGPGRPPRRARLPE